MTLLDPRTMCRACRRPEVVCWCAHLPHLPTRTRVLLLQHTRESRVGIGTARMAHLALPNSQLRVGVDFGADPVVAAMLAAHEAALAGNGAPSYLLFPGADARDIRELDPAEPITLVVVDGTWAQARALVRRNPQVAALPRLAFNPRRPSDYRIRREPADFCVSTIEALVEVLNVLEPERAPFDALLDPFRAMVDRQIHFQTMVRSSRQRRAKIDQRRRPRASLASRLAADWRNLVCVQGEANGWPMRDPNRHDPEIVHFAACRPASGEIYEAIVAPRRPLAPLTPFHIDVPAERLHAGITVDEWRASWQAFCRPDDVLVQWGNFYATLATEAGVPISSRRIDVRGELSQTAQRQRGGTLEECTIKLDAPPVPLPIAGRAGRRLAALVALIETLRER